MTHDPLFTARLLHGPTPVKAAAVHDFIPLDAPDRYLGEPSDRFDYETRLRWLRRYDLLLPVSEATAARARAVLGADARPMRVTGAALDPLFVPASTEGPAAGAARHVLVVGGAERKDADTAVRAHARSRAMQALGLPLIVTGSAAPGWLAAARGAAAELGGRPTLVRAVAHVPEAELKRLYRDALCVAVPSRDEGFSLPVVEAMASGVPVLASRIPVHEELVADPAALFPVGDDEALARLLARLLDRAADPLWRAAQVAANAAVWPRFLAEAVAERFWGAVADRIAEARAPARTFAPLRGAKPRLAMLSPLRPARSGIADYTAGVCAALGERADLHLFSETPAPPVPAGARSVAPLSALPFLDARFDGVVGVMGNSDHHLGTLRGLLRYGGAAILHDGRLLDLYHWCMGDARARGLAERDLGRPLRSGEMEDWLAGTGPPGALLLGELAEAAAPLIVHARATEAEVARRHGTVAKRLPFALLRGFHPDELRPAARAAARARLGLAPGDVLVATLGFTHPTKAPEDVLWTLDQLRAWGVPARLLYVGEAMMDFTGMRRLAVEIGVADHVDFGGAYVGEAEYRDVLLAADVAVQLRTFGPGSVSAALADCVAAGLPAVASTALVDALDAPSYVRAVPDAPSPPLVAEAALALLQGASRADVEEERSAYAARRSYAAYVAGLLELLGLAA
jgi:glycosyltransferase involved in cell wall biosynthesis